MRKSSHSARINENLTKEGIYDMYFVALKNEDAKFMESIRKTTRCPPSESIMKNIEFLSKRNKKFKDLADKLK